MARAFEQGKPASEFFEGAETFAAGLRVPKPYGDDIIPSTIVRASGGKVVASDDATILASIQDWAKNEEACSSHPKAQPRRLPMTRC